MRWCPACRCLQCEGPRCQRCADNDARAVSLVRGLASIDVAEESGLVRYRGEGNVHLAGLTLIALVPLAAAAALASNVTWLATALVAASFIGLPALAFLDAQRAGNRAPEPGAMPEGLVPAPPARPALPARSDDSDEATAMTVWAPATYRGEATATGALLTSPISGRSCLCYRLDIRVGEDGELMACYTSRGEFAVTCADGTQVLITGLIELSAPDYGLIEPTDRSSFSLGERELLPSLFTRGGWACEIAVEVGAPIRVAGVLDDELRASPLGSSYRQAGAIRVLRGAPGRPVVIELL